MHITTLGIDIAKSVFHLYGTNSRGKEVYRKRVYRDELLSVIANLKSCRIVIEACGGSNYWVREFEKLGHKADLIAPQYVKPFVKRNKNDWRDAEAICVAAQQPNMRYVPKKTIAQQDIQQLHRVRERLVKARTALVNEMRGFLGEYGIVIARGRRVFTSQFLEAMQKRDELLSENAKETLYDLWEEYNLLEKRVKRCESKLKTLCKSMPVCQRLEKITGVGFITATAMVAAVGDASVFRDGRQLAAWLGITPREHSTGGRQKVLGISKRGDSYLRKLLIHGARISLRYAGAKKDKRSQWATDLKLRKGTNIAAVALAHKTARTIWAVISKGEDYKTFPLAA